MKTTVKSFGIAMGMTAAWALAPVALAPVTLTAHAQEAEVAEEATGMTLDQLLEAVKQDRIKERAESDRREAEFKRNRSRQQGLLNKAKADVKREEAISLKLEQTETQNNLTIARLEEEKAKALGEFNELVGVVKQVAGDTRGIVDSSLISSQLPGRGDVVGAIAERDGIPTSDELRSLWYTMQQEMTQQGKVARYTAEVTETAGDKVSQQVVRVGPFTAVTDKGFVNYRQDQDSKKMGLVRLTKQPPSKFTGPATSFAKASGGIKVGVIDPSMGTILDTFVLTPGITDRIAQGAQVGVVIIILGAITILLALIRILSLWSTSGSVRRQVKSKKASKSNPLGRVLLAYEANAKAGVETLELKLDEAILKEVPKLERGLNTMKVVAAVAPMLGLLGTVTGMILTFQAITLFGAGDPKMMAGGISQA